MVYTIWYKMNTLAHRVRGEEVPGAGMAYKLPEGSMIDLGL